MKNKHLKTFIALTGCTSLALYGINKLVFYTAALKDFLSDMNGSYYDWRFGKVYYRSFGSGSPILLIHDLNECSSGYEWYKLIEDLSKSNTVYVLDLLGCGRSEKCNITYTNFLYVQLISDFIKNIIKHKTDIIATGISSSFVLMSCSSDPELYGKIMMINPENPKVLSQPPSKKTKSLKFLINTPLVGTLIYNMLTAKNMVEEAFEKSYFYNNTLLEQQDIDLYYEAGHKGGPSSKFLLSSLKGRYVNINICSALKQINNSIYLLAGKECMETEEIINNYLTYNSAIETVVVEKAKHLPQLETPKKVLEQIKIFFAS